MCSTKYYAQGSIFSCPLRRCVWTHLTFRGWPSTWNRLYLKGRRPFTNTVLSKLSLNSTVTQSNVSENHVKLSSMKPRYKAWKKKTRRHGGERLNVCPAHTRILRPCETIFILRVLKSYLHRTGERYRWGVPRTNGRILPAPPTGPNPPERTLSSPPGAFRVVHCETLSKIKSVSGVWSCGPDEVPNWLLQQYSELLAYPVRSIINASLRE